jgi:hypothetical protein
MQKQKVDMKLFGCHREAVELTREARQSRDSCLFSEYGSGPPKSIDLTVVEKADATLEREDRRLQRIVHAPMNYH